VLIVPKLIKGGFIVGGEGGDGVLLVQRHGGWSAPAFYAIGAGSFGLQAGLEQSEVILLIMTQKGLDGVHARSVQDRRPGRHFGGHAGLRR
jgi:lipid-binding SYLF domain-containing protein